MLLDILCAGLHVAKPLSSIVHEQSLDQVLGSLLHVLRPLQLASEDLLVDEERVVVEEGRVAGQHLVDQDAKGPPVNRFGVALQGWLLFAGCGCGCGWGNNNFFDKCERMLVYVQKVKLIGIVLRIR